MGNEQKTGFISSKELKDLYDCVALAWRGNFKFDKINHAESMLALDASAPCINTPNEIETLKLRTQDIANRLKPLTDDADKAGWVIDAPNDLIDELNNLELSYEASALLYYRKHLCIFDRVTENEAWAIIGRYLAEVQFRLHTTTSGKRASSRLRRAFTEYILDTFSWWLGQITNISDHGAICAINRNGDVSLPLKIIFASKTEKERFHNIFATLSMTEIVKCLKTEQRARSMRHQKIIALIEQEIQFHHTSTESFQTALRRGKTASKFDHYKQRWT